MASESFWGIELPPNTKTTFLVPESKLEITQAALGSSYDQGRAVVSCTCAGSNAVICTLGKSVLHAPLRLTFSGDAEITFSTTGEKTVFLSGISHGDGSQKKRKTTTKSVVNKVEKEKKADPAEAGAEPQQKKAKGDAKSDDAQDGKPSAIVKLVSGLEYQDTQVGSGAEAKSGKKLSVRYKGMLENGSVFDSNMPKGRPFQFSLGAGEVIKGWDVGFKNMKVGGRRMLFIPAAMGYGPRGSPPDVSLTSLSVLFFSRSCVKPAMLYPCRVNFSPVAISHDFFLFFFFLFCLVVFRRFVRRFRAIPT